MSPNVTHATPCLATAKRRIRRLLFLPLMWEKEAQRLSGGLENPLAELI